MNGKSAIYYFWAPAILALLIVGLVPMLVDGIAVEGLVRLDTTVAAASTAATATPATATTETTIDFQDRHKETY